MDQRTIDPAAIEAEVDQVRSLTRIARRGVIRRLRASRSEVECVAARQSMRTVRRTKHFQGRM